MATEAAPTLGTIPGIGLASYQAQLIDRFANPAVADPITRLCPETSTIIPAFLLPVIRDQLAAGRPITVGTAVIAAWSFRASERAGDQIADQRRDDLVARARDNTDSDAFIRNEEIFGDLAHDEIFRSEYRRWRDVFRHRGVRHALVALTHAPPRTTNMANRTLP